MKKFNMLFLFILVLSILAPVFTFSQVDDKNDQMKVFMNYMTPGPEHKLLAQVSGDWTFELKFWMDPNAAPLTSTGTATYEMIFGNRYQLSHYKSTFMNMPYDAMNIIGFDNGKKVFMSIWYDNMGTGTMYSEGTYDEATKTFTFKGKSYDPMSNKDEDFRQTTKTIDDNNFIVEMFMSSVDKEIKTMEINYKRK
jgi:hypothetical protein